jgi:hypothetical protein
MTVLVAMGERHLARLCEVNLARQGWIVLLAQGAQDCIDKAMLALPELVVVDADLVDSATVKPALAEHAATSGIKVIVMGEK